ncbi:MAG: YhbY family RNA-binding protein [Peptococcaceae bacterium]|jgi:RNA-binding protein|nr:YhbY family RNA-binding protein [Peptococcaceae bacterium]
MLTGKQKRFLRAMGSERQPELMVGKGEITAGLVAQAIECLTVRELVKGRVLPNCLMEPQEVATELADQTDAELVQIIGRNFLLYRRAEEPIIKLP